MSALQLISLFTALPLLNLISASPTIHHDEYRHPSNGICTDYTIKSEVTSNDFVWGLDHFNDNYDVAAFLFNNSRKDTFTTFQPFSGTKNVTKQFEVAATFCTPEEMKGGKEKTVLVATHGLGYDRRYWAPSYKPDEYSFVQYALANGYSIFYYDRLGTGKSQILSGYTNQASNQIEILSKMVQEIRKGMYTSTVKASKIVLVGHSFGSFISDAMVAQYPGLVEGVVLTGIGFAGLTDDAGPSSRWIPSAFASRIASTVSSAYRSLDSGYLSFGDVYAHIETFFHQPNYAVDVVEYAQAISQPFAIAEYLSLGRISLVAAEFKGPVFITSGQFDLIVCGGECKSTFANGTQKEKFPKARVLETYAHPGAGHGVNFGANATGFFGKTVEFLDKNF
ncbi:alpha/beta-hydrolase [Lindgomyces ingoldianus]|uniref:Alpha/beta-hydrolase n=1 Tax=Lindgomyces ingoldianus TaxID=673940 RepID=A0ACB6QAP8_9PLEO|nr:alpha/beta-hydrolase [Lindgomyces ingoldianus]KAF2464114.1 alpha/beta-hydrolase [Lindgomyces ingoldianus]